MTFHSARSVARMCDRAIVRVQFDRAIPSVRIASTKTYSSGLFISDFAAMAHGCAVWPAYWSLGRGWPDGGEMDIIEGVNQKTAFVFLVVCSFVLAALVHTRIQESVHFAFRPRPGLCSREEPFYVVWRFPIHGNCDGYRMQEFGGSRRGLCIFGFGKHFVWPWL